MKLIFVYNAEAGLAAGVLDSIHKIVSPSTYPCSLCAITYGVVRMDPKWKAWLKAAPFESVFHHRPDFRAAYPRIEIDLPAILVSDGGEPEPLVLPTEFAGTPSIDALIALIEARLAALSPAVPAPPSSSQLHP